jgi:hypothetical protein
MYPSPVAVQSGTVLVFVEDSNPGLERRFGVVSSEEEGKGNTKQHPNTKENAHGSHPDITLRLLIYLSFFLKTLLPSGTASSLSSQPDFASFPISP